MTKNTASGINVAGDFATAFRECKRIFRYFWSKKKNIQSIFGTEFQLAEYERADYFSIHSRAEKHRK